MDSLGNIIQLSSGSKGFSIPEYMQKDPNLGLLKYRNIRFLISGRASPNTTIINKTNKIISIPVETKFMREDAIEDDSYFPTIWICNYKNGSLKVVYKSEMEIIE